MKINADESRVRATQRTAPTARATIQPSTSQASAPMSADSARFSPAAKEVNRLRSRLRELPEIRTELVARIQAQVDAGLYKVEPRDVAEKLLKSGVLD